MMVPLKGEVEAVANLLAQGAENPTELAKNVIRLVEEIRGERQVWVSVFELSPGVYQGYGPYATKATAEKAAPKLPLAQIARRGAFVPLLGPAHAIAKAAAAADAPPPERGDFALIREDAALIRKGWRGKNADRSKYLGS